MNSWIENYQRVLFPYAYNVLGTVEDAEDVIQDTIIKFSELSADAVNNPKNYLIKSVINRAIQLKRKQSKTVLAEIWLPEPMITKPDGEHREILNFGILSRLEYLNVKERAVFVLKEGFEHSHEEIGEILSFTPENSRTLLSRAKRKLKNMDYQVTTRHQSPVSHTVKQLIYAIQKEDISSVKSLLAEGIQFYADGGREIQVVAKECRGNRLVSELLVYVQQNFNNRAKVAFSVVNHQPAALYVQHGRIQSCQIFEVYEDKIIRIDSVIDPEKLAKLNAV